jgi:hypothetical protein
MVRTIVTPVILFFAVLIACISAIPIVPTTQVVDGTNLKIKKTYLFKRTTSNGSSEDYDKKSRRGLGASGPAGAAGYGGAFGPAGSAGYGGAFGPAGAAGYGGAFAPGSGARSAGAAGYGGAFGPAGAAGSEGAA